MWSLWAAHINVVMGVGCAQELLPAHLRAMGNRTERRAMKRNMKAWLYAPEASLADTADVSTADNLTLRVQHPSNLSEMIDCLTQPSLCASGCNNQTVVCLFEQRICMRERLVLNYLPGGGAGECGLWAKQWTSCMINDSYSWYPLIVHRSSPFMSAAVGVCVD